MKWMASIIVSLLCSVCALEVGKADAADSGSLVVDCSKPGPKIGPLFYGLMTEEINHSYDGGLYAELIQNRIFESDKDPVCWSAVGSGSIAIDETNPVNAIALKRSLRLDCGGELAGIANSGFWGIPVWPNTRYHASFYARADEGARGPLTLTLESTDGKTTFATATVAAITGDWTKYQADLTTGSVPATTKNRFVISSTGKGSIWFSLVSLFPPTYHNRPNGNRVDISEKLAALHPSFLRFPGGNFLEGNTIATRFDWKKTIGPLENRPGHAGCWGYRASDGLGLLEFLGWCEDLKMEPLLAVYAGYSMQEAHVNAGNDLAPYVQDALDEIEYCTGDASTPWGKHRAADGHPQPFVIHYIEIGNEDLFDQSGSYDSRFTQIFNAIKARYPHLLCIATARTVHSCTPDLYDDHGYPDPHGMLRMVHEYDHYKADQPKVFFGEWATQDGTPTPTMRAALCDAAWMTGLQRNCDTVRMNCYAPLLTNVNPGAWEWPTNLIGYDAVSSFGSPSYYAQSMFSRAWGDTTLPLELVAQKMALPPTPSPRGGVGVGMWQTAAEFKDLSVKQDDKELFASDFENGLKGWMPSGGQWEASEGVLRQTDSSKDFRITAGQSDWQNYTLRVKARKTAGKEGFLIMFHVKDATHYGGFNVGGWGNTKSTIQFAGGGGVDVADESPFTVETGKWYDVRIELRGLEIKCYIDDKLILSALDTSMQPVDPLYAAASKVDSTSEVILKVVNTAGMPQQIAVNLQGVGPIAKQAAVEILQGDPDRQNTVESPRAIAPTWDTITDAGPKFTHVFPAHSISVIRLEPMATSQGAIQPAMSKPLIDYFLPTPVVGLLTSDAWGAAGVLPRDVQNGLEDPTIKQWCYWDGKIIKAPDGKYHLFASRWDQSKGHYAWWSSVAVHAVSDNVNGPYVDKGPCWPDNQGGKGHNVTALELPDKTYAVVVSETRPGDVFVSKSLDGPWQLKGSIQVVANEFSDQGKMSNVSIMIRPDGDFEIVPRSGAILISKDGILGPYTVQGPSVYAKVDGLSLENLEDPVVWFSGGLYHIVVNSWSARKAYHLVSVDGITGWKLQGLAYDPTADFIRYTNGTVNHWNKIERPNVLIENGHVTHFTFAVIDVPKEQEKGNSNHGSKVIVVPFDGVTMDHDLGKSAGVQIRN